MSKIITIEYCTSWGYVSKAVSLAQSLLGKHKSNIKSLNIVPSSGGVFEIKLNDELIFSKKELGRFPEEGEIEAKILENM